MFKHIVFFRFQDPEDRVEAKRRLETLPALVPSLRLLEVGLDSMGSARSWDMSLLTTFDNESGYQAYAVHPQHLAVVAWIKTVVKASATVDYEVPPATT